MSIITPFAGITLLCLGAYHRAEPSDVGEASRREAGADALSSAADRAYRANPTTVAPSAKGEAVRLDAPQYKAK